MRLPFPRVRALHGARVHSHAFRSQLRASSTAFTPPQISHVAKEVPDGVEQVLIENPRRDAAANSTPSKPAASGSLIQFGTSEPFHPVYLRDCCTCPSCVDSSTRQKNFQTTDIPANIRAKSTFWNEAGEVEITWENDIPGFDVDHVSRFSEEFLANHATPGDIGLANHNHLKPRPWNVQRIKNELEYIDFKDYMSNDAALFRVLKLLEKRGLVLLRGVPESEKSVEEIGGRIGTIRDSLYGRTWDVKSVPEAKNVAYTHQSLGLHQDLLYMQNPPGFQLLHCLKNTCKGGASLFSDAFWAAGHLTPAQAHTLARAKIPYHYKNAGEHYYHIHRVIEYAGKTINTKAGTKRMFRNINYSPPFQAPYQMVGENRQQTEFPEFLKAFRKFARETEKPGNVLEYRMQEGECVLFNNRRILHGRKAFETDVGERWLKGAYVETDAYMSRHRVLSDRIPRYAFYLPIKSNLVFKEESQESFAEAEAEAESEAEA